MSKNFDETVRLQSQKRQEWIREIGGKRLQGIAEGTSIATRLANSSAEIEVLQNKEFSGGGKDGENESVLLSVGEEQIGGE